MDGRNPNRFTLVVPRETRNAAGVCECHEWLATVAGSWYAAGHVRRPFTSDRGEARGREFERVVRAGSSRPGIRGREFEPGIRGRDLRRGS